MVRPEPATSAPSEPAIRVLIAKPGLDGHDRGALVLVRALREAGFIVEYTGIRRTPAQIAEHAAACGAQLVGVSVLSGAHLELLPRIVDALAARGLDHVPVMAGGIIPEADRRALLEMGIAAVFGPGARTGDIAAAIRNAVRS